MVSLPSQMEPELSNGAESGEENKPFVDRTQLILTEEALSFRGHLRKASVLPKSLGPGGVVSHLLTISYLVFDPELTFSSRQMSEYLSF